MSYFKAIATAAALPLLMGCGAGGGTGLSFAPVGSGPFTVAELKSLGDQLDAMPDVLDETSITLTTPSVASATYTGFIEAGIDLSSSAIGRVNLNADFAGGTVSGVAGDFSIFEGSAAEPVLVESMSGTLPITSGTISGATMSATMDGSLGGAAGTYGVATTLDGWFVDVDGQGVAAGILTGTLTNPDTSTSDLDGGFVATQN